MDQPINANPYLPNHSKLKNFLLIFFVLFIIGAGGIGYLLYQGVKDAPKVNTKVSSFMQMVSSGDNTNAYQATASEFQKTISQKEFDSSMALFKAQYSEFKSQQQTGFYLTADAGKSVQYKYSGVITYNDGDKGELSAVLIKENGEWKILGIEVNVTVARIQKFQQQNKDSVLGVSTSK